MVAISVSASIAAPVDEVFALFVDLEHAAERIKAIQRVERLTPGPVGEGTRFRETRVMFGREATEEMEFKDFAPGHGYTLVAESCGVYYETTFSFQSRDGGTAVSVVFITRPRSLVARLMAPLSRFMLGPMRRCLQDDLDDLRAVAEAARPVAR